MIVGILLVVTGVVGVLVSSKKADETDPLPNPPTDAPPADAAFAQSPRIQHKE
jgi:hypothetical protein